MQDLTRKLLISKWQKSAAKISAHARKLHDEAIECKKGGFLNLAEYYEIRCAQQQRYAAKTYAYVRHLMEIE